MALVHSQLAFGQLPSTTGVLYTVDPGETLYLKSIYLHNTGSTNQTIKLYLNGSANSNKILEGVVSAYDTFEWDVAYSIILNTGETVRGSSTNASTVNYFLFGGTE